MRVFKKVCPTIRCGNFPSFSEGLSLREFSDSNSQRDLLFPFLFGGTFIEGNMPFTVQGVKGTFPFLFGGTFIEGLPNGRLRGNRGEISLPFRRDFH